MSEQEQGGPQQWGGAPQWGQRPTQQPPAQPAWGSTPQWGQPPQWNPTPQWGPPGPGHGFGGPGGMAPPGHSPYGQPRYVAPPKPGIVPLRPLMFGEILDGAFQTVRRNPAAMLGAGIIAQALASIMSALIQGGALFGATSALSLRGPGFSQAMALTLGTAAAIGALLSLLSVLISVVMQGAMAVPVARALLNRRTGFRQMWVLARSRTGALLGLAGVLILGTVAVIAVGVLVTVLSAAVMDRAAVPVMVLLVFGLFIAMLWLGIRFLVAPAAIVVEELGTFAGLRRSWQLTGRNWWRILGVTIVVGILVGVLTQIVLLPVRLATNGIAATVFAQGGEAETHTVGVVAAVVGTVVTALVAAVGFAFQTSTAALLYADLRMRKDGLDLDLLRQLETGSDPAGVPGRGATVIQGDPSAWARPPFGPPPVR